MRQRPPRAPGIWEASISDTSHSVPASSMNSRANLGSMDSRLGTSRSRITPRTAANSAPPLGLSASVLVTRPFDWSTMRRYLGAGCTPGVEAVSDSTYSRTVRLGDAQGWIIIRSPNQVVLSSSLADNRDAVLTQISRLLNTNADIRRINQSLS